MGDSGIIYCTACKRQAYIDAPNCIHIEKAVMEAKRDGYYEPEPPLVRWTLHEDKKEE